MMKKNKKAVVLGGGGHFGIAWELGYLRGLEEGGPGRWSLSPTAWAAA